MDPFSLVAAGLGTAGALYGGIKNAIEMPGKKRKYIREQKEEALHQLRRQYAASMGYPVGGDGAGIARKIQRSADENFQVDPMSFVPFVGAGTQLAGQLYDAGKEQPLVQQRLAPDPIARQQQAGLDQQDALERAQALAFFKQNGWQGYGR